MAILINELNASAAASCVQGGFTSKSTLSPQNLQSLPYTTFSQSSLWQTLGEKQLLVMQSHCNLASETATCLIAVQQLQRKKHSLCKSRRNITSVQVSPVLHASTRADLNSLTCLDIFAGCQIFGFSPFTLKSAALRCCSYCQGESALHCSAAHQGSVLRHS